MNMEKNVLNKKDIALLKNRYMEYMFHREGASKFADFPAVDLNPFLYKQLESIELNNKIVGTTNGIGSVDIVDRETGQVVSDATQNRVFVKRQMVDKGKFVKIFENRLKEMFNLSHSAIKVMGYFINEISLPKYIGKDSIYFNKVDCMEFCGYNTHNMVYKGLTELLNNNFVAKSTIPGFYFIDHNIAFNGNRIVIMEEYIKEEQRKELGDY